MKIVYIHGANATSMSFNYIRSNILVDDHIVDYQSQCGFFNNLSRLVDELKQFNDIFFVAHSLGGIYALHIANILPQHVIGAVSLSTPYGGSEAANFMKFLVPCSRLLRDIGPYSEPISAGKKIMIRHPWANIVSTAGSSALLPTKNDGVVTLESMQSRNDIDLYEIPVNHYEIVLSPATVNIINSRLPN